MQITISNKAQLPNKHLRFIKWKLYRINEKFGRILYAHIFLRAEGRMPRIYSANIRLGIPGNDIIIRNKSENWGEVIQKTMDAIHRYIAKHKVEQQDSQS